MNIKIDRVEITEVDHNDGLGLSLVVAAYAPKSVADHNRVYAYGIPLNKRKLAERLKAAMEAGKVFSKMRVKTDVLGKTYIDCETAVGGRHLNADLKRLGF